MLDGRGALTTNEPDMLRSYTDAVLYDQRVDAEIFRLRFPHIKTRLQRSVTSILHATRTEIFYKRSKKL